MKRIKKNSLNAIEAFSIPPDKGQFAINGDWENPICFLPSSVSEIDALIDTLKGSDSISFEAFFGTHFIGVRNNDKTSSGAFIKNCINAVSNSESGEGLLEQLALVFNVPILGQSFNFAELGAEGIWNTLGGIKLELSDSESLSEPTWECIVNSHVYKNTSHIKAIELACDGDYHHWIAIPVSKPDFPFKVERKLVEVAIKLVQLR
ncbi:hypothetical protein IMCC1989_106 [gamma proteobacterium IMCC1989]|nr:hypothetical protein IMCC1989_106 [gamma proteobacterium IMCC1989]